jgi:membrane protease YdiL (CAAX protease family)
MYLTDNEKLFIVVKTNPVLCITIIGGVIFAITFLRTRSLLLTSIEHALYGSWLFTAGMGEMLAFPMPQ